MRFNVSTFAMGLILLLGTGGYLHAQSAGTTYTGEVPRTISVFGEASRVFTDYGVDGDGYTFGGDYAFNKRLMTPSVEARYTHGGTDHVNESDFEGGIKLDKRFHRFDPYINALIGYGVIHFNFPGYTHDNSVTYDLGLGLDYMVTRALAVRIDAQQQYWKLGTGSSELEPQNISIGIVYHVPFGFKK